MMIRDALLPEFDMEMAKTRTTIERVPEDQYGFRPHLKSFTAGALLTHLATIPHWGAVTLENDSFDVSPDGNPHPQQPPAASRAEALQMFDANAAAMRAALAGADNEQLMKPWSLLNNGQTVFTMPRTAVLRGMIFNHLVHHRGQLTVYLRLMGAPVPALYGPSADEGTM
jgi:uncharacterized damage-inducible protein DinB